MMKETVLVLLARSAAARIALYSIAKYLENGALVAFLSRLLPGRGRLYASRFFIGNYRTFPPHLSYGLRRQVLQSRTCVIAGPDVSRFDHKRFVTPVG